MDTLSTGQAGQRPPAARETSMPYGVHQPYVSRLPSGSAAY